jgi:S-adenosylmethionine:tRNA ribosyltransferase-isomerase
MSYQLDDYDYVLPPELIAQQPVEPRDHSRLMVLHRASQKIEHRRFLDLPEYVDAQDCVVANNTRVIPARLEGKRILPDGGEGGRVEFLLLEEVEPCVWEGAFHASAKHKPGVRFRVPTPDGLGLEGELVRGAFESPSGTVWARFDRDPVASGAGEVPLPHYINRQAVDVDQERYQTLYAKQAGSAAAPTAGLHFTDRVIESVRARGAGWEEITLHVGIGTFRPVKTTDIRSHVMHEERYVVEARVAERLSARKASGGRVLAVGTTTVRTLESAWDPERNELRAGFGRTQAFIYPGGQPIRVVDRLITNFHLPKSTLLMLISALAGREFVLEAYREAVREKYRFFSYGDAMLIL